MNKGKPSILAVDDEKDMLKTYENILKKQYDVSTSDSGKDALDKIKNRNIDLVILDIKMPQMDGIEVLKKVKAKYPNTSIVMATASKDVSDAIAAMKLGALDYVTKPFDVSEFKIIIEKAIEKTALIKENIKLKETLKIRRDFPDFIGKSRKIQKIKELIASIAKTDSTILITGESGSGKEVAAKTIHNLSVRNSNPFIAINCAAIPENLLEAELFGFERGAFTGALERRIGKFELADSGTLFLDEIGCMSPGMQSKLLRVLEERKFERLGGNAKIEVDVRIISATNIDFEKAIKDGKFREDLYYRLNVIPINLPPLRERREDIELFISFFISKYNKEFNKAVKNISQKVKLMLTTYSFPGNVRELQNLIERAVVLTDGETISDEQIFGLRAKNPDEDNFYAIKGSLKDTCDNFEKNVLINTLRSWGGNQTKAAEQLGIARTTITSKISTYGIKEEDAL